MTADSIRVLLVEDNEPDYQHIKRTLKRIGDKPVQIEWISEFDQAKSRILYDDVDIYIIDYRLADENGIELVSEISKRESKIPIIVMTGQGNVATDVEAMTAGADDYLVKGEFTPEMLERSIRYAIEHKRIERELALYQHQLENLVEQKTKALLESEEKRRQADRLASLGALSAGIAHEINNPVGAIILIAQNALESIADPGAKERLERACQKIITHAERCAEIVRGILRFARQEPTEKLSHDINQVIRRAVEVTARTMQLEGQPQLDLSPAVDSVPLNRFEFEQVVSNLLRNALEADSNWNDISISTFPYQRGVKMVVSDKGRGIPPDQLQHIFDPFFTTRLDDGGTGLGLSIVHGIIAAHGGSIAVESTKKGTTFTVILPGTE